MEPNNSQNRFTKEDRACVNCRHFRRFWNPFALLDIIFGSGEDHYRCIRDGVQRDFNPITGRVKIKVNSRSCEAAREYRSECNHGAAWEPSERFARRKENLFKVINHVGDDAGPK
jgi:hypothetical protein